MIRAALPRLLLCAMLLLVACSGSPVRIPIPPSVTLTPFLPSGQSQPVSTLQTPLVWVADSVPDGLKAELGKKGLLLADSPDGAAARLEPAEGTNGSTWVYALAAAFPTTRDSVSLDEVKAAWNGQGPGLVMSAATQSALQPIFGGPAQGARLAQDAEVTGLLWQDRSLWAILPFEDLNQKMKVLEVDGGSPLRKGFDLAAYPLKAVFSLNPALVSLPLGNRDPQKLTTVLMTGTTALVRAISYKMQINGADYPGRDIGEWLRDADILHISNEVAFTPTCPPPDPMDTSLRFCSAEQNIALLDSIGVDVVELTGNHLNDWGNPALIHTLDLYRQRGIQVFGGGTDSQTAREPAILKRNGVKFAFVGCNTPGPDFAWAGDETPGAADCGDYAWLTEEIRQLKAGGAVVIATLQHYEYYSPEPRPNQVKDFRLLADAGADVVSGSQAHYSQAMEFYGDVFIHYGLGNLFFDQMGYSYEDGTRTQNVRREFLDRYVFYDGRLVGIELLTAMLEDYSRPRPMTPDERQSFLQEYFAASGWGIP